MGLIKSAQSLALHFLMFLDLRFLRLTVLAFTFLALRFFDFSLLRSLYASFELPTVSCYYYVKFLRFLA